MRSDLSDFPTAEALGAEVSRRHVDAVVATPPLARRAGRLLAALIVGGTIATVILPWQQNVSADGHVVALDPAAREQRIAAPIKGRAVRWHVQEGQLVEAGTLLVELSDVDPELATRLEARRAAVLERIDAQEAQVAMLESQVKSFREAVDVTREAAALRVTAADQKVRAARQKLEATRSGRKVAALQDARVKRLREEGLSSERDVEVAELARMTAGNQVGMEAAAVGENEAGREAARADGMRAIAESEGRVASAEASLGKARAELASARADLLTVDSERARQAARFVKSPQKGWVMRLAGQQEGALYDVGELLAVLAPATDDRAVALAISGNDGPIVRPGARVQIQFEGWPAVFFAGWPGLSTGTFTGKVASLDALASGDGGFRVLVVPDTSTGPWPEPSLLRQGVRVRAWVFGREVPLGYELWRVFNGFPLDMEPEALRPLGGDGGKKSKKKADEDKGDAGADKGGKP